MNLQQKLKKVPSPIREMIEENIRIGGWRMPYAEEGIEHSFWWRNATHIPDSEFWDIVHEELLLIK